MSEEKEVKWVIVFVLPSGNKFVASILNDSFALVPIAPDASFKGGASWKTQEKACQWLHAFLKKLEPKDRQKLVGMNPKILPVKVTMEHQTK